MAKSRDIADVVRAGGEGLEDALRGATRMDPPSLATLPDQEEVPDPAVQALLVTDKAGFPRPIYSNAVQIVERDHRWDGLRLNELGPIAELDGHPIQEARLLNDLSVWITRVYGVHFGPATLSPVVAGVIAKRPYNPVKSYLSALKWDETPRLDLVASSVLGAEDTQLNRRMVRRFFIGAVARAMKPGCKLDTALILVGPQGTYKSTFFRVMFGQWFSDSPIPIGNKDAFIQLAACWGYEAAEMESLNRSTAEAVKQFMSASSDTFRGVFERHARPRPRQSVLVGSTNRASFLSDDTGSRRFWPITIPGMINIDLAREWRDQLWAEAVLWHEGGEQWHLTAEEDAEREGQAVAYGEDDAWEPAIREYLLLRGGTVKIPEMLVEAVKLPLDRQDWRSGRRAGAILRKLGWERLAQPRLKTDTGEITRPVVWGKR